MTSYPEMRGRLAVVTGAASGIGAATAEAFAAEGASVAVLDIARERLDKRAAQIAQEHGVAAVPFAVDVADRDAVFAATSEVARQHGPVHYVVNCAASFTAGGVSASAEDWTRALSVNVQGCANVVAGCARHMPGGGAVVNTASVSAHSAQPERWPYNATKGAIVALTKCQALDLSARGIRVNCVSPGWIWTPEVAKAAAGDRERWEPVWGRYHMLRRLGEATEVADASVFLCSAKASFITATELMVDGGYSGMSAEGLGESSQFAGSA